MLRPGEFGDLQEIAGAWDVPPATAAWAIIGMFLAEARDRRPDLPIGLSATLSMRIRLGLEKSDDASVERAPSQAP